MPPYVPPAVHSTSLPEWLKKPEAQPPKEPKAQPPKAQPPKASAVSMALAEASPEDRIAKCLRIIDTLLDRALADGTLFAAKIAAELVGDYLAIIRRLYEECASGSRS